MTGRSTNWPLIALVLVAGLFAAAQFAKFTLTLGLLTQSYGGVASILVSVVGFVGIIFGAVAGGMIARAGLRRALVLALVAGAVLSLLQASLPASPIMLLLRILEGLSHLAVVVAAPTLVAAFSSDHDRPVVMSLWASFFGVGFALTAVLLPTILAINGLASVLILHGAGMLVMAVALWAFLPPSPRSPVAPVPYISEHIQIYKSPTRAIAGLGFLFYTLLYIALIAVLPAALGLSATQISILPLVSLIGTFAAGFLARRYAPPLISITGFALTVASLFLVWLAPGALSALVLFLATGLIPGGCFATIPHYNTAMIDRARATGAIAQCGNLGTTTGTPIFVAAMMWGGLGLVVTVAISFCVLGILSLIILWPRAEAMRRTTQEI